MRTQNRSTERKGIETNAAARPWSVGQGRKVAVTLLMSAGALTLVACAGNEQQSRPSSNVPPRSAGADHPQFDPNAPFPGTREVVGVVDEIRSDQVRVETGDLQPRYLPAKMREKKNLPPFKVGDEVVITLNGQNQVVDAHLEGEAHHHKILHGQLAQPLPAGQEKAVIRMADGHEESYPIRSQARAKVGGVPVGVPILVLIDEAKQIADVTYASVADAKKAGAHAEDRSPIKHPFAKTSGVISSPLSDGSISITDVNGQQHTYKVRPLPQAQLKDLDKGAAVILMVDDEHMVTDVAIPPGSGY